MATYDDWKARAPEADTIPAPPEDGPACGCGQPLDGFSIDVVAGNTPAALAAGTFRIRILKVRTPSSFMERLGDLCSDCVAEREANAVVRVCTSCRRAITRAEWPELTRAGPAPVEARGSAIPEERWEVRRCTCGAINALRLP